MPRESTATVTGKSRYLDAAGEAFEMSVSIHPADRFTFSMELVRGKEPAAASIGVSLVLLTRAWLALLLTMVDISATFPVL